MRHDKMITVAAGALAAVLALGGIGYAYAAPLEDAGTTTSALGRAGRMMHRAGNGLAGIVADLTGLDVKDVAERRADGESFAAIAESEGVDPDDVKAEALDRASEAIDERLYSTEAPQRRGRRGMRGLHPVQVLAEMTGLDVEEIHDLRVDGKSFSEIATENGVDPDDVVDAIVADAREKLDAAVADGKITEERATEMLDRLSERLSEVMDSTEPPPEGGPHGDKGPGGGPGAHGGPGAGPSGMGAPE